MMHLFIGFFCLNNLIYFGIMNFTYYIVLDQYFKSLKIKYKAFEADNPTTLQSALQYIDSKEKKAIQYSVNIPGHDYSKNLIVLALVLSLLILFIKNLKVHSW